MRPPTARRFLNPLCLFLTYPSSFSPSTRTTRFHSEELGARSVFKVRADVSPRSAAEWDAADARGNVEQDNCRLKVPLGLPTPALPGTCVTARASVRAVQVLQIGEQRR